MLVAVARSDAVCEEVWVGKRWAYVGELPSRKTSPPTLSWPTCELGHLENRKFQKPKLATDEIDSTFTGNANKRDFRTRCAWGIGTKMS